MVFDFYFNQDIGGGVARALQCGGNASGGLDVVFLDQDGIEQADTMVHATAAGNRIFLRVAKARNRFARVQQFHAGTVDCGNILGRNCRRR